MQTSLLSLPESVLSREIADGSTLNLLRRSCQSLRELRAFWGRPLRVKCGRKALRVNVLGNKNAMYDESWVRNGVIQKYFQEERGR
jgi:hypothetical protein